MSEAARPTTGRLAGRLLRLALFSAGGAAALWWGLAHTRLESWIDRMTWFRLEDVRITSEWPLSVEQVRAMLPPLVGKNLVLLNARSLVTQLESKPWIETVTVKKEYPNRLLVDVGTRRAQAILVQGGQPQFVDSRGVVIERATPALMRTLDLPILTAESLAGWDLTAMIGVLDRLSRALEPDHRVGELGLQTAPFFRVFLQPDRIEVLFRKDNWEEQLPRLVFVLRDAPSGNAVPRRINLIFSKKTIVSAPLSH